LTLQGFRNRTHNGKFFIFIKFLLKPWTSLIDFENEINEILLRTGFSMTVRGLQIYYLRNTYFNLLLKNFYCNFVIAYLIHLF
jgi:hypothetical protein